MGQQWKQWQTLLPWAPKSLQMVASAMKLKDACSLGEKLWPTPEHTKKQSHHFANKGLYSQTMIFPVVMYGSDSWTIKKAEHRRIDAFELWYWEKTLESPLDYKEIKAVNPKGNQSWIFIGRADTEADTPTLWPPDAQSWLTGKDPYAGKDWSQEEEEKGTTEDSWMASPTRRTWVWASSVSWWRTGKPGVLQSVGLQRVRHNWVTELN